MSGPAETSDRPSTLPQTSAQQRMLRSSSTRYLSAAAYLDADFRNAVLHELLGRRDRAVAPAFSADAVPVVRHALNARRHQLARDAVLTALLIIFLVIQAKVLLALLALACALLLGWRSLRALLGLHVAAAISLLVPALIALLVSLLLMESSSGLFSSIDGSSGYETHTPFWSFVAQVIGVLVVVLGAAWTTVAVERLANRQTILDHLMPNRFVPAASPTEPKGQQARIRYIGQAQTGNVTYYAQGEQPFVGAGTPLHTWTWAVPLVPSGTTGELTTESLRETLSLAIAKLNGAGPVTDEVSVQDRLATPAKMGPGDPRTGLLQHRLSPEEMDRLTEADEIGTHRYLSVRMAPGRGDYEIWVFVRCLIQAQTLHLDLIGCCLPPVRARYREIDQYAQPGQGAVARTVFGVLPELPGLLLRAPLRLLLAVTRQDQAPGDLRSRLRQMGTSAPERGARTSVRELATDQDSSDVMAGLAMQRQIRLIEQRVLESVATSLEQAGFSAEEFRRRTQKTMDGSVQ